MNPARRAWTIAAFAVLVLLAVLPLADAGALPLALLLLALLAGATLRLASAYVAVEGDVLVVRKFFEQRLPRSDIRRIDCEAGGACARAVLAGGREVELWGLTSPLEMWIDRNRYAKDACQDLRQWLTESQ